MKRRKTAESPLGKDSQRIPVDTQSTTATRPDEAAPAVAGDFEWRLPSGQDLISFALAIGFSPGPPPPPATVRPARRRRQRETQ